MACEAWQDKIEAYADGELSATETRSLDEHVRNCASCAADLLGNVQVKLAVKTAGKRYSPSPEFRQRVVKALPSRGARGRRWHWIPALAATAGLVVISLVSYLQRSDYAQQRTFAELADLHVATLASLSPVDVISTDRHTVKPWFAGKIPFTFNLPEFANTPFALEGGRISYLGQAPGAQLLFKDGNHRISVFIFQDSSGSARGLRQGASKELTFNVETWSEQGLRYIIISDVEAADLNKLRDLLRTVAKS